MDSGRIYIQNESYRWKQCSTLPCRDYSEPTHSQSSRLQVVLTDHVKIGPVTVLVVFKSARTSVTDVTSTVTTPTNSKSRVRTSRGTEQYARQFIPSEIDHQHLVAAPSQQSTCCGRLRAQETGGNSSVRCRAAPKPKLFSIGFSRRVWKSIPVKTITKRDCEFLKKSPGTSRRS